MRLFVAVTPSDDVLDLVAALPRPEVAGLRWTTRDQWHVTLCFLGRVADESVSALAASLVRVSAPNCTATVGPAVERFGQRVLHVPVSGLSGLAAAVVEASASFGDPPVPRPFAGHLTLARSKGGDLRRFVGAPVSAAFDVGSFTLFRSELHPHGARYSVVEEFALPSPS